MSLGDAAGLALQNDPRLRAADAQVQSSAAGVDLARADYTADRQHRQQHRRAALLPAGFAVEAFPCRRYRPPPAASPFTQPRRCTPAASPAPRCNPRAARPTRGARADADATSQRLLLDAATAYLDLERDRVVIDLARTNLAALQQELSDTNKRFAAGEATAPTWPRPPPAWPGPGPD